MTERGNHEGKRGDLAYGLNHPDPFRNQVRCSGVEKIWRKNINFAFAQITDLNGKGHEVAFLAVGDFETLAHKSGHGFFRQARSASKSANLVSVMR
jgi:hypothetical protein